MIEGTDNAIAIEAYRKDNNQLVSRYESMSQCSRDLFIRHTTSISKQVEKKTEKGLKSYKTGIVYYFKKLENERS